MTVLPSSNIAKSDSEQDEEHQRRNQLVQVKQGKADVTAYIREHFGKKLRNSQHLLLFECFTKK